MNRSTAKINATVLLCDPDRALDEVVVLRLTKHLDTPGALYPGKRYGLEGCAVRGRAYNRAAWFAATRYLVDGINAFYVASERARLGEDGGPGYLVCGAVAPGADQRSVPRSKVATAAKWDADGKVTARARPKGMVDADRHWHILDIDDAPAGGLDPRRDPAAALARLRSALPPALAGARTAWRWSGSTCLAVSDEDRTPLGDRVPETVGAHMAVWLDIALDEAGRRDLDAQVALYVAERLPGAVVDRAVGIYNQAVFCAVSLEDGLQDPFPGDLRSGVIPGAAEVCLADLLAQLPALPGKTPTVLNDEERAARAAARKAARDAAKARRGHDTLLRAAGRLAAEDAVVAPGFVRRDPISVAYANGRAARVAARKQIFRERALADIVRIVDGRREADRLWGNGVPDGMRRRTMCAVAALLSWLVPVHALEAEIERYGVHLIGRYWVDDVVTCRGLASYIVGKAKLAEVQAAHGDDPAAYRDDRCKVALMRLLDPTEDEQVEYGLQALRSEAVRSEAIRRAKGKPTLEERREKHKATSARSTRPWEALGVSQATYYRKRRSERAQAALAPQEAAPAAPEDALTTGSVLLLADVVDAYGGGDVFRAGAAARLTAGLGIPEVAESVRRGECFIEILRGKVRAMNDRPHHAEAVELLRALDSVQNALKDGADLADIVEWALDRPGLRIAERSAGPVCATRADVLAAAGSATWQGDLGSKLRSMAAAAPAPVRRRAGAPGRAKAA